jgi:hypothetical protein
MEERRLFSGDQPFGPLVRDPLAAKDLLGLTLLNAVDRPTDLPTHWWDFNTEPSLTSTLSRGFSPGPDGTATTVDAIVAFAESHGWTVVGPDAQEGPGNVALAKPYGDKTKLCSVWVSTDSSEVRLTMAWQGH